MINDYILKTNILPKTFCKDILAQVNSNEWTTHDWYYPETKKYEHTVYDPQIQFADTLIEMQLFSFIKNGVKEYMEHIKKDPVINSEMLDQDSVVDVPGITNFSKPRFNKYSVGTLIHSHLDHIHSIFDGDYKGIPILTILFHLNDNYTGGEFVMRGEEIKLQAGDLVMFPSNFMYPHKVRKIKTGTRYTCVTWGF